MSKGSSGAGEASRTYSLVVRTHSWKATYGAHHCEPLSFELTEEGWIEAACGSAPPPSGRGSEV